MLNIGKKLRKASLNLKFRGSYKKKDTYDIIKVEYN